MNATSLANASDGAIVSENEADTSKNMQEWELGLM